MIRVIKKVILLIGKKQTYRSIKILLLMFIGAVLEAVGVGMIVPLVAAIMDADIINSNKYVTWICGILNISSYKTFIVLCTLVIIFILIIKDLYLIFLNHIQYKFIYDNRFKTQKRILESYMNRSYEFFLNADMGEIIRDATDTVDAAYGIVSSVMSLITQLMISAILFITILVINPLIILIAAVIIIFTMIIITRKIKPSIKHAGLSWNKNIALSNKWLLQAITGIKDVKVSQTEQYFQENFDKSGYVSADSRRKSAVFSSIPRMIIEMTSICSILITVPVLILCGIDIITLVPALSAFAMAAIKILPAANLITTAFNTITFYEVALDRLLEILGACETLCESKEACAEKIEDRSKGLFLSGEPNRGICLYNIVYHYPNATTNVLNGANMVIPVGKSVGIVGTSGAGKTTAIDIMLGLLKPQEGQVLYDGKDIYEDYAGWLNKISYIPQLIFMLDDTIRANVAFGKRQDEIDDERVWAALREAQLDKFVKSLPNELDTSIGDRGIRVSGGQRQRIGIARALYTDPEILLFDEATSALDNDTEEAIMEAVDSLRSRKTMIIIAHRLSTIENCDLIYKVENGQIILTKGEIKEWMIAQGSEM